MFLNRYGKLGYILYANETTNHWFGGPVVYTIEVNNLIHTVHPYLVEIIFEMFGIND